MSRCYNAGPENDYLGFSGIIFPRFLFVMGMFITFSIENRIKLDQKNGIKINISFTDLQHYKQWSSYK